MSRPGWKSAALASHCEIFSGYPFASAAFTDDADDVHLVKGENIGQGQVLWDISKRWPRSRFDDLHEFKLLPGDVVLAMDRPWVPAGLKFARIGDQAPDALVVQRVARLRARQGLEQSFLQFLIASPQFEAYIKNAARGVTVPHISAREIGAFTFELPPMDTQRAVAEALQDYDDLIDNNRRRIKLLEDSVRLLFDEWFVRLRFPGHERLPAKGALPKGWSHVPLGSLTAKIGSGATPRGGESAYVAAGIALIRSQNVYDFNFVDDGLAYIDVDQAARLDGVAVEHNDILLNITGASVARCCMVPQCHLPARVNQHVMIIRADQNKIDPYYLLCAINSEQRKRQLLSYAQTGSTREALTKDLMSQFEFVLPDATTLRAFGQVAAVIFRQREVLAEQVTKLKSARDLLLPRLMSGALVV